ncbi:MAG: hypothetical protein ACREM1_18755 [Longimicrobiales bacterium]
MATQPETLSKNSPFWEKCARHTTPYTARRIAYFFLCDACTARLIADALNGRAPIYHGEHMQGFCGLCNELTIVAFRQWFLCPVCYNVVASYQKALVSAQAVLTFWEEHVRPAAPSFVLTETDTVNLKPFVRAPRTKRQTAENLETADFLVSEKVGETLVPRFHIELKAGPGSVDEMSEFQLDVNDYNDIAGPVTNTGLPAYVFHVQLGMEYFPPTWRSVARNLWWTDIMQLRRHLKRQARRRDESKAALYFDPAAFHRREIFVQQVIGRAFEQLRVDLMATPVLLR